jgi:hypothetical protein
LGDYDGLAGEHVAPHRCLKFSFKKKKTQSVLQTRYEVFDNMYDFFHCKAGIQWCLPTGQQVCELLSFTAVVKEVSAMHGTLTLSSSPETLQDPS